MQQAMDEDLAELRRVVGPRKANRSDIVRAWSLIGNRHRLVKTLVDYQAKVAAVESYAEAARREAESLRQRMEGLESTTGKRSKNVAAALRTLALPSAVAVRTHLQDLVRLEATGKPAPSSNVTLSLAKRDVGSWRELAALVSSSP